MSDAYKNTTVKQIKLAIDEINKSGIAGSEMVTPSKAPKAQLAAALIDLIKACNDADQLDNVPANAWDTYRTMVPRDSEPEDDQGMTEINYDDTPEGQADLAGHKGAPVPATTKKEAAKQDAAQIKHEEKVNAKSVTVENEDGTTSAKKFTKADAFWGLLNQRASWNKLELAEALKATHGKASLAEAKFWVSRYGNMLEVVGLVAMTKTDINVIER